MFVLARKLKFRTAGKDLFPKLALINVKALSVMAKYCRISTIA